MAIKGYLPNAQSFASGLPEGKSRLQPKSAQGRTRRERNKQQDRFHRIRKRSADDLVNQKRVR